MKLHRLSFAFVGLLVIVLVLSASGGVTGGVWAAPGAESDPAVTLTADGVVRAWPGSSADALGTVPARSSIPVSGRTVDFGWWQIPFSSGPGGFAWLAATVVLPNGVAASVPIIQVIVPTPVPPTPIPAPTPQTCTLDAAFVADVTVPDGTQLLPGQSVNKVWRMHNTGTCAWEATTLMKFVSGFQLGAPQTAPVPNTPAGGTTDIGVTISAPPDFGQFRGIWQLQDEGVNMFGPKVTLVVNVNNPNPAPPPPPPPAPPAPAQPKAVKINFWADSTNLKGGKCTKLHWDVSNATRVDFNDGKWRGVGGQDSRKECPGFSTTYRLRVIDQTGKTHDREAKINVAFKPAPNPNPVDPPGPVPNPNPDDDLFQ